MARVNHVTPKNYLDFINSYTDLLKQKDKFFLDQVRIDILHFHIYSTHLYYCMCTFVQCHRLSGGLTKLIEASEQLSVLNEKLEVQKAAVTKKTAACEELLSDISSKTEQAKEKQQMAQAKSVEIEEQNKVIVVEKVM